MFRNGCHDRGKIDLKQTNRPSCLGGMEKVLSPPNDQLKVWQFYFNEGRKKHLPKKNKSL